MSNDETLAQLLRIIVEQKGVKEEEDAVSAAGMPQTKMSLMKTHNGITATQQSQNIFQANFGSSPEKADLR